MISSCYEFYVDLVYLWHVPCSYLEGKIDIKGVIIIQTDPVCGMQVDEQSAAAMALSSVTVATNALRLRRFKLPEIAETVISV